MCLLVCVQCSSILFSKLRTHSSCPQKNPCNALQFHRRNDSDGVEPERPKSVFREVDVPEKRVVEDTDEPFSAGAEVVPALEGSSFSCRVYFSDAVYYDLFHAVLAFLCGDVVEQCRRVAFFCRRMCTCA